ncbi:periplasmic binding protein-like II [Neocallimastix lanati (nom. inval.)]|nr:periplasmic binding protein-like II [Neocallimastix sp. JGI-2020a]
MKPSIQFIFLLLIILVNLYRGNGVTINAIALSMNGGNSIYSPMVSDFNQYSKNNGYNITIDLTYLSRLNSTATVKSYEETLESLFNRKSDKYDIIFYDNIYTSHFEPYLLDLQDVLSKEHIDLYIPGITTQTGFHNDKLVGIPLTIDYSILISNSNFLNKYNRNIPKTWDELIDSGVYILNEEIKRNNTDFIVYNGLFPESEMGFCSIYEFIYSYRNSVLSPFPSLLSSEALNALKKIKEIKEKLFLDDIYHLNLDFVNKKIEDGNFLFLKTWSTKNNYATSILPGVKEGISGSILGGHNLGINKYSKKEKRAETIKALEYLTSREMHIKYLIKNNKYSPIISLYDDEEVCQIVDCNFFKSIQLIERPANIYKNYNKYSELFRKYTYEYIFENKMTAEETIKSIYELTKSIKNEGSSLELVISIIIITASVVMLLLLFCLLNNKYIFYFKFLPRDFWVIVIIGLIITMSPFFTKLGELNSMKCYFKYILFFFGSTLYMKPLLYKLIINIPEKNVKLLTWISKNRYIFLLFLILIDTILYGLLGLSSFDIENKIHNDTINFKICKMKRTIGKIMIIILYTLKFIEIILGLFLIFIEWNLKLTYYDLRFVVIFFYINILYFIFIIITNSLRIDDYNFNLALPEFVNIFFTFLII